jgi:hypothetical protein
MKPSASSGCQPEIEVVAASIAGDPERSGNRRARRRRSAESLDGKLSW